MGSLGARRPAQGRVRTAPGTLCPFKFLGLPRRHGRPVPLRHRRQHYPGEALTTGQKSSTEHRRPQGPEFPSSCTMSFHSGHQARLKLSSPSHGIRIAVDT